MSWVTIIWSMAASACLTLAAMHLLVWFMKRTAWANLLFALSAGATTGLAFCELGMMRAQAEAYGCAGYFSKTASGADVLADIRGVTGLDDSDPARKSAKPNDLEPTP
jgi:hypothetical protein